MDWDPAHAADEVAFLMNATFDSGGRLVSPAPRSAPARARRAPRATRAVSAAAPRSTMADHAIVPVGTNAYIRDLRLPSIAPLPGAVRITRARAARTGAARRAALPAQPVYDAKVNVGSLLSFVDGVGEQDKTDVLYSVQLAQRGASGTFDRFTQPQAWYQKYVEVLENLGWAVEQFAFTLFDQREGEFRMDQAALASITAIATQNQLAILQQSISALSKLADSDGTISLFDFHASLEGSGNFQLGSVQRTSNGALSMAVGAFHFRAADQRRRFLFFKWGSREVNFWTAAQRMTVNLDFYARNREAVIAKLESDASKFIGDLRLGSR